MHGGRGLDLQTSENRLAVAPTRAAAPPAQRAYHGRLVSCSLYEGRANVILALRDEHALALKALIQSLVLCF